MMNKFFSAILLATSFAWLVSAQEATVYTQCTKPKTAAITFVSWTAAQKREEGLNVGH